MKNFKRTFLFVTLLSVGLGQPVQARKIPVTIVDVDMCEATSWASSVASGTWSALKSVFGNETAATALGAAAPIAGAALMSSYLPFGIGTAVKIAAPYVIAAGAKVLTNKITGNDREIKRREKKARREERRLKKMLKRIMQKRKRSKSKSRRPRQRYYDSCGCDECYNDYGFDYDRECDCGECDDYLGYECDDYGDCNCDE